MDYALVCDPVDGISIHNYKVGVEGGLPRMEEIQYYNKTNGALNIGNGDNSSFASGARLEASKIGDVTFTVTNEKVAISVSGKLLVDVIKTTSASYKDQVPAPTSILAEQMQPYIKIILKTLG